MVSAFSNFATHSVRLNRFHHRWQNLAAPLGNADPVAVRRAIPRGRRRRPCRISTLHLTDLSW